MRAIWFIEVRQLVGVSHISLDIPLKKVSQEVVSIGLRTGSLQPNQGDGVGCSLRIQCKSLSENRVVGLPSFE